jgi:acetyl esterase/lipase
MNAEVQAMSERRPVRAAGPVGLWLILGAASLPAQVQPTHPGLIYTTAGPTPIRLDLYIPSVGQPPYPVVVWIHGGGWSGGSRYPAGQVGSLLSAGFAVASIDYRLTSQAALYAPASIVYPAQIHDCKTAIRWLRANAGIHRLDRSRFGVWGSSAGGHLSALVGTSGNSPELDSPGGDGRFTSLVQACGDYFGPTDLLNMNPDTTTPPGSAIDHDAPSSPESHLLGWDDPGQGVGDIRANIANPDPPYPDLIALADSANPITFVDSADPPFFIAHGTNDVVVPIMQSVRLADALAAASVPHTYAPVPGAGHGNLGTNTNAAAIAFFTAELAALPSVPGDLDGDRAVELDDLLIVLSDFGCCAGGDVTYDGITDLSDLLIVLARFGR